MKGADGYDIYVQYCNMKFKSKPASTKKGNKNSVVIKKINGKKLNLRKNYKIYVIAYKNINGKKVKIGITIVGRKNYGYSNAKTIKVQKTSYSLKKGKTACIKVKTILVDEKKKQLENAHTSEFRYKTSNETVAKVSKTGQIKVAEKGSCIVYIYSRNGYARKIKVVVS